MYFIVVVIVGGFLVLNILPGIVWAKFEEAHMIVIEEQKVGGCPDGLVVINPLLLSGVCRVSVLGVLLLTMVCLVAGCRHERGAEKALRTSSGAVDDQPSLPQQQNRFSRKRCAVLASS